MCTYALESESSITLARSLSFQLQSDKTFSTSTDSEPSEPTIGLYVQYNGFFNQFCDIRQTTTIEELFVSDEKTLSL